MVAAVGDVDVPRAGAEVRGEQFGALYTASGAHRQRHRDDAPLLGDVHAAVVERDADGLAETADLAEEHAIGREDREPVVAAVGNVEFVVVRGDAVGSRRRSTPKRRDEQRLSSCSLYTTTW